MTDATLTPQILALEERLLSPDVRQSADELAHLLSDDFLEYGSSGTVWDKGRVLEELPELSQLKSFAISDFRVEALEEHFALATYRLVVSDSTGEERRSLRSSVWRHEPGGWRLLFHQGTLAG